MTSQRTRDLGTPRSRSLGQAERAVTTIPFPLDGLPRALVLQQVTLTDAGFRAELLRSDVRLVP